MKKPSSKRMPLLSAAVAALMLAALPIQAELVEKTKKVGGTTVRYKVVLPNGYAPAKAYPAILVFGGGPQTMNTVDGVLDATSGRKRKGVATSSSPPPRRTIGCSSRRGLAFSLSF
jgi:hypothetical protein